MSAKNKKLTAKTANMPVPKKLEQGISLDAVADPVSKTVLRSGLIANKKKAGNLNEIELKDCEALINYTDDLLWSVSSDFKLIAANKAFIKGLENFTGLVFKPGDDLLPKEIFAEDFLSFWKYCYKKALFGKSFNKEIFTAANNSWKESWTDTSFNPIYKDGEAVGIACYSRNITGKKIAEEKLRQSEARLILAQHVAKIGSWETDLPGLNVIWSEETYRIFELDPGMFGEISHPGFLAFVHPEDQALVEAAFVSSLDGHGVNTIEHRIISKDGHIKILEERWRIFKDGYGKPVRAVGTCQDITERKKAEKALQAAYDEKNIILESIADAFFAVDKNWVVTYWNKEAEKMLHTPKDEIVGRHLWEVFPNSIDSLSYKKYHQAIESGQVIHFEDNAPSMDKWYEITAYPSIAGLSVYFKDVSERKRSEAIVQKAYEEKNTVLERIDDGFFAVDKNSIVTYWNKRAEVLLDTKKEDLIGKNLHEVFFTRGSSIFYDNYVKALSEKITVHFEGFSKISNKWLAVSAYGSDNGLSVYFKDITEQKNAGEKIKESELRYRSLNEQATDAICITDASMKFININPYACEIFGYTEEEVLQLSLPDILFAEDLADNPIKLKELKLGKTVRNERRLKRKDGTAIHMEVSTRLMEDGRMIMFGHDITARKKAEEKMFKAENRFRVMIEKSTDMKTLSTRDGEMIYSSPSITKVLGYSQEEFCSRSAFDMIHPDDIPGFREKREQIMQMPGGSFHNQNRFLHKNGNWVWCEGTVTNMLHEPGVNAMVSNFQDISEKRKAEQQREFDRINLDALINNTTDLMWSVDKACRLINFNQPFFDIIRFVTGKELAKGDDVFSVVLSPEQLERFKLSYARALSGEAFTEIEYIPTPVESWSEISYYPIRRGTEVIGTACHSRDITERKRSEINLELSEKSYRRIVETAQEGIWVIDENNKTTFVNKRMCEMLEYTGEEMIGRTNFSFKEEEEQKLAIQQIERRKKGVKETHEAKFITKSGRHIVTLVSTNPIFGEDGSYGGAIAMFTDITERRKIDESNKFKAELLNTVGQAVIATNMNGIVNFWNKAAEYTYGWTSEEAIGKNILDLTPAQQTKEQAEEIMTVLSQGHSWSGEFNVKRKDGRNFPAYVTNAPIYDQQQQLAGIIGVSSDITERKQAELNLKESNERYNLISKATNDMVWDWDLVTGKVYRNKEGWKKIFRTGDTAIENESIDDWDNRVHPEDQGKVIQVEEEILRSEKDFFEVECRMLRDDGTYAYIHDRGNIIRNERGEAVRLIGATQDITERKEAELQVAKSEFHFRSLVQNSTDLINIVDEKGFYSYCSPAVKKALGYEPEYIIGKNAFSFIHPDDIVTIKTDLVKLKTGNYFEMPHFRFKNEKGEWRWLESTISIMTDNPEVGGFVFNSRDITERKIAEEEINKLSIIARETVNAVIITNPAGEIVWVNEAFTRITEFEPEEVIGKKPGDFLQGDETSLAAVRFMRNKIKSVEPFDCDIVNYSKSGRKYWLRIQSQPQYDETGKLKYFFAIETDITKEKEDEEILRASEERYRYLFNNNPASIFIWDINNFKILEVNDTAIKMYGYQREEFLTKTALQLSNPEDSNKIKHFASIVRQKSEFRSEVNCTHLTRSGEKMHMNISSHLIQFKGRAVILALATNITDKILLENELENERQAKQEEITDAVISAQEKERQQLGSELHDNINQILAGARLYLGLVQKELQTEHPYLKETDTLISSAITEIRTLSHSLIPPSLSESELIEALNNIVATTQITSGIKIILEASEFNETDIPDKLKLAIYRIVQEQFNNILKHAHAQKVIVRLIQDNEKTVLSIKDDGVGFDVGKKANGVGLLNIKTRASLFNGDLAVNSSPGNGCELRVLFN